MGIIPKSDGVLDQLFQLFHSQQFATIRNNSSKKEYKKKNLDLYLYLDSERKDE
jgi:hypothetical protein